MINKQQPPLTANINGTINSRRPNLTWWPIKHINYIHRTIPIIITCLVRINKCCWCSRPAPTSRRLKISINSSSNNRINRKCRRNWTPAETITSDNRHPRQCGAMRMDPRVTRATTTRWTIQMWVSFELPLSSSPIEALIDSTLSFKSQKFKNDFQNAHMKVLKQTQLAASPAALGISKKFIF